ncbi:DUF2283 domain-containing protein [Microbacterium maritypicum]
MRPILRSGRESRMVKRLPRSPRSTRLGDAEKIILDFDTEGHVIGMEILSASALLRPEALAEAERI